VKNTDSDADHAYTQILEYADSDEPCICNKIHGETECFFCFTPELQHAQLYAKLQETLPPSSSVAQKVQDKPLQLPDVPSHIPGAFIPIHAH
jgi:hypothetical protein